MVLEQASKDRIMTYIGTPISFARFSAAAIAIRAPSSVRVGCETAVAVHDDRGAILFM